MNAIVVMDKPAGMTSHDVVARMRRILREKSIGHLGTLDPMATGVLPLVTGAYTRLAQFYTGTEKSYEGEIRLGFTTDTYDADGQPTSEPAEVQVTLEAVTKLASQFVGVISQVPPPFSAKKIAGVPAYKLARKKQEVELQAVQIQVRRFDIVSLEGDRVRFAAEVSSGTYIRSIAHELGKTLGVGGHLASLRRTRVGEFGIEQAITLERAEELAGNGTPDAMFVHPRTMLPALPSVTADDAALSRIRHGNATNLPEFSQAKLVKVFAGQRELVAIAARVAGTLFQPKVVFPV